MNEQLSNSQIFAKWQINAYAHYERGPLWYIIAGIIGGGLLIAAFLTHNFLLAVLIVMVGIVLVVQGGAHPPVIDIEIGSSGIRHGRRFFSYRSINHFWIVYDPPIKVLYLTVPRSVFPTLHIPIDGEDPVELRNILKKYIKEDMARDSEPIMESISRILKI